MEGNNPVDIWSKVSFRYKSNGGINRGIHKEFNGAILLDMNGLLLLGIIGKQRDDKIIMIKSTPQQCIHMARIEEY